VQHVEHAVGERDAPLLLAPGGEQLVERTVRDLPSWGRVSRRREFAARHRVRPGPADDDPGGAVRELDRDVGGLLRDVERGCAITVSPAPVTSKTPAPAPARAWPRRPSSSRSSRERDHGGAGSASFIKLSAAGAVLLLRELPPTACSASFCSASPRAPR
jgi:hypothetical protein